MLKNKTTILLITLCFFVFPMQDGNTAEDDGLSSLEVVETPRQETSDAKQNGLYEPQNKAQALMKTGETPFNKQTGIEGGDGQGQIKQFQVTSENTIEGSITAKGKSDVSIGSTHLGEKKDGTHKNPGVIGGYIDPNLCSKTDKCQSANCSRINEKGEKEKCHIVDGCSIPDSAAFLFNNLEIFGEAEDCCDDPKGLPCNNHDMCYQTCGKSIPQSMAASMLAKTKCDTALLADATLACLKVPLARDKCFHEAELLFTGVGIGGWEPWFSRQFEFGCGWPI